jgi:hypothetical protein
MPKFFVAYELGNIRVQAEADTAREALQHIEEIGEGMVAIRARFIANEGANEGTTRPVLALVKDEPSKPIWTGYDAASHELVGADARTPAPASKKLRTDQKKGAKAQLEAFAQPEAEVAPSTPAATPKIVVGADVPLPVGAAKIDIATALRNFARTKGVPAASAIVASFKIAATGEAAARVDQISPEDYPAFLAKIEGKSK